MSRAARRSIRASTRLWMVGGTPLPSPSSALRSSCSRNSGLPSARSMHCMAKRLEASIRPPASARASSRRNGPRSMVSRGTAVAGRTPLAVERVAFEARRHRQHQRTLARHHGRSGETAQQQRCCPMDVLEHQQARPLARRVAGEIGQRRRGPAAASGVVHRVEDRALVLALLQVEQIADQDLVLGCDEARLERAGRALRVAPDPRRSQPARGDRRSPPAAPPDACRLRSRARVPGDTHSLAPWPAAATLPPAWTCRCRARRGSRRSCRRPCLATLSSTPASCRSSACLPTSGRRSPVACRRDAMRYTRIGPSKPLTAFSPRSSALTRFDTLSYTGCDTSVSPGPASASSRAARFTASPVTAYLGVAPPESTAATTSPLATPMCSLSGFADASCNCAAPAVQVESRAHRPLGVVAVSDRRTEHRQHAVAGMVDDAAAVGRNGAVGERVEAVQQRLDVLGIHARAQRGVAGDVGEQHGGLAAFTGRRGRHGPGRVRRWRIVRCRGDRGMGALRAELGLVGKRASAAAAGTRQRTGALFAESGGGAILVATAWTFHSTAWLDLRERRIARQQLAGPKLPTRSVV